MGPSPFPRIRWLSAVPNLVWYDALPMSWGLGKLFWVFTPKDSSVHRWQQKFTCSSPKACWCLALFLTLADVSLSSSVSPTTLLLLSCFTPGDAVIPRFKIRNSRDQKRPQIISPPSWLFPRAPSPNLFSPVPYDFTNRAFSSFLQ